MTALVDTTTGEITESPTPYQLLPRLTDEEFDALKDDIAANGIRVPIDVDETGTVIDGHHRAWIAADLGIECPRRVVSGLTDEQKRAHAIAANVYRRSLNRDQRREMVRRLRELGMSTRQIAEVAQVSQRTVAYDVSNSAHVIPPVVGTDGKTYNPETLSERRELAAKLRDEGLSVAEIGVAMGVAKATAQTLLAPRKPAAVSPGPEPSKPRQRVDVSGTVTAALSSIDAGRRRLDGLTSAHLRAQSSEARSAWAANLAEQLEALHGFLNALNHNKES